MHARSGQGCWGRRQVGYLARPWDVISMHACTLDLGRRLMGRGVRRTRQDHKHAVPRTISMLFAASAIGGRHCVARVLGFRTCQMRRPSDLVHRVIYTRARY